MTQPTKQQFGESLHGLNIYGEQYEKLMLEFEKVFPRKADEYIQVLVGNLEYAKKDLSYVIQEANKALQGGDDKELRRILGDQGTFYSALRFCYAPCALLKMWNLREGM